MSISAKKDLELTNLVILSGRIINKPKWGYSSNKKLYIQFVIECPKWNGRNLIPCMAWGDSAKNMLEFQEDDWIKLSGKINTFVSDSQSKFQVLIDDAAIIDV